MASELKVDTIVNAGGDNDSGIDLGTNDIVAVKTANTERMRVDASGNLAIGTTSASDKLHIDGAGAFIRVNRTDGESGITLMYNGSNSTRSNIVTDTSGNLIIDTVNTERMRVDTSGRLLVGTTSTSYNDQGGRLTGGNLQLTNSDGQLIRLNRTTASGNLIELWYNGGEKGSISTNGSNVSYNTSSDYRLKENVKTDWDASTRLKQLKPSQFNWKVDKDTTVDGFLAHEVSSIVPEAVSGEKDAVDKEGNPKYQGIDQSKLVPLLTKALQEAISEIDTLKEKVKALESK